MSESLCLWYQRDFCNSDSPWSRNPLTLIPVPLHLLEFPLMALLHLVPTNFRATVSPYSCHLWPQVCGSSHPTGPAVSGHCFFPRLYCLLLISFLSLQSRQPTLAFKTPSTRHLCAGFPDWPTRSHHCVWCHYHLVIQQIMVQCMLDSLSMLGACSCWHPAWGRVPASQTVSTCSLQSSANQYLKVVRNHWLWGWKVDSGSLVPILKQVA